MRHDGVGIQQIALINQCNNPYYYNRSAGKTRTTVHYHFDESVLSIKNKEKYIELEGVCRLLTGIVWLSFHW